MGLNSGRLKPSPKPKYMGMRNPIFSGKNLPSSKVEAMSYCRMSSRERSLTLLSTPPKPTVFRRPVTFTVPKSAKRMFTMPVAAQPSRLSNSVRRSSLNQTSPHFSRPSSLRPGAALGLRTPSMMVWMLLKLGLPRMVMRWPFAKLTVNGKFNGQAASLRICLARLSSAKVMLMRFSTGQMSSGSTMLGGVSTSGCSYS